MPFGTSAEEGGSGKVYGVRDGQFDDVDIVLHWHAGDRNSARASTTLANRSAKFRFNGVSAHAAGAPEKARSALDGVEAINHMINLMREHVPQETRIHYVITAGGYTPNVVPDFDVRKSLSMVFATHLVLHDWPNSEPLNYDLQELVLGKEADDVNNGITRSNAGGWQSAGNLITWKESCIETFRQRIE